MLFYVCQPAEVCVRLGNGDWRTVARVAADAKYIQINESARPYVYVPFFQAYRSSMILHTRGPSTSIEPGTAPVDELVRRARALVETLDADTPIPSARPMTGEGAFEVGRRELLIPDSRSPIPYLAAKQ